MLFLRKNFVKFCMNFCMKWEQKYSPGTDFNYPIRSISTPKVKLDAYGHKYISYHVIICYSCPRLYFSVRYSCPLGGLCYSLYLCRYYAGASREYSVSIRVINRFPDLRFDNVKMSFLGTLTFRKMKRTTNIDYSSQLF